MSFDVSATGLTSNDGSLMALVVLTGATETGGTAYANHASATVPSTSITPAGTNSYVLMTANHDNNVTVATMNANNTLDYDYEGGANSEGQFSSHYSGTVTAGTPITVGYSAPSGKWAWAIYEVLASGGSTPVVDATTPTATATGTGTNQGGVLASGTGPMSVTTNGTPPGGAVLVLMVAYDVTAGTPPQPTISDTSGLSLTWTLQGSGSGNGNSGSTQSSGAWIFTTTIPSSGSTFNGTLTTAATAHASFGGTKTGLTSLAAAATAHSSFAGTKTGLAHLTTNATAHAVIGGIKTGLAHLTTNATAHAVIGGIKTGLGHLTAGITAAMHAAGTKTAKGVLTAVATARAVFIGFTPVNRPPMNLGGSLSVFTLDATDTVAANTLAVAVSQAVYAGTVTSVPFAGALAVSPNTLGGSLTGIALGGTMAGPAYAGTFSNSANFAGTASTAPNLLGVSVSQISLGGSLTGPVFGGTDLNTDAMGGTISATTLDGTIASIPFSGSATGWTMQNINLSFAEFNDITLTGTITNNGSALNLTGYTVNMYLKPAAGIVDTDGRVKKLSSGGGSPAVTITNAAAGAISVFITNADVQDQTLTFYRIDAVDASSHINTAIYGNITYTAL